jgi:hypothetical protein
MRNDPAPGDILGLTHAAGGPSRFLDVGVPGDRRLSEEAERKFAGPVDLTRPRST